MVNKMKNTMKSSLTGPAVATDAREVSSAVDAGAVVATRRVRALVRF